MKPISYFLEQLLVVDGVIRVVPFNADKHDFLNSKLLWQTARSNQIQLSHYGDDTWLPPNEFLSITFHDACPEFKHELKAFTLGMTTYGAGEGMEAIKWSTARNIIQTFKRFGVWLNGRNIHALSQLDGLSDLRLRNLVLSYLQDHQASEFPSVATDLSRAVYWLSKYSILNQANHISIFDEILMPYFAQIKASRKSHSIIPTGTLKKMLKTCDDVLVRAEKSFFQWERIHTTFTQQIPFSKVKSNSPVAKLTSDDEVVFEELFESFRALRTVTFVLALSYSGMRLSEVKALEDGCGFERNGEFFLKSKLSKTTDGKQDLEWVTSESAFKAVELLSKCNRLYRERAKVLLEHHSEALSKSKILNLQFGLATHGLFQVQIQKKNATFHELAKLNLSDFKNFENLFSIRLTEADIAQLERLDANYQSVSRNHQGFKKPYEVGMTFNFTAHQFRHTFAWFIIANRLGDLDDIKYQYKHLESVMTLVYGQRGYESIDEFENLVQGFEEYISTQAMTEIVEAAQDGSLGGKGGERFIKQLQILLENDLNTGAAPHFSDMKALLGYLAKHSRDFRGLPHGYCLKGASCKVKNSADPSHCIYCDGYIATRKHLPHWKVIKEKCESQLASFEQSPKELQDRFQSFKGALLDNIFAANFIIKQIESKVAEA